MDPVELSVDGFPLDPSDPDVSIHRELGNWLELETPQAGPVALRFDPAAEWTHWLRAALRRFAWLQAHRELIPHEGQFETRLARLIGRLVNRIYPPPAPDEHTIAQLARHAAAIDRLDAGSMFRADTGRLLLAAAKAGIAPDTRDQIHAMLRAIPMEDRFGSLDELAWHLFLDEADQDPAELCCATSLRQELRAMKPAARKPWMALLKLALVRRAPDGKWTEKIRTAVDKLGRQNWRDRASAWSAKAAAGHTESRATRILLRHVAEIDKALETEPAAPLETGELLLLLQQGSYAGFEQVVEFTKRHGYRTEIVEAVRQYHGTLHGSVTDQARRQHVGWWLWLDDVTPISQEECWSSIVRADLRTFTGSRRNAWLALIGNMTFAIGSRMPAKWAAAAQAAMKAIEPEDFATQMRRWLAPMAENTPLRLTTSGRDILRTLIWDCQFCPADSQLDEALAWIYQASWKNKESRDRMLKIEGPLAEVLSARSPDLAKPSNKPAPQPAPQAPDFHTLMSGVMGGAMSGAMSRALQSTPLGDRIEVHPDHISVRGQRDEYRIAMDGVITRRSGRRVRVNMDSLPPYITQLVQPTVDAVDLAQGMFQPNRMRLFSLATILAHDAQWESAIE